MPLVSARRVAEALALNGFDARDRCGTATCDRPLPTTALYTSYINHLLALSSFIPPTSVTLHLLFTSPSSYITPPITPTSCPPPYHPTILPPYYPTLQRPTHPHPAGAHVRLLPPPRGRALLLRGLRRVGRGRVRVRPVGLRLGLGDQARSRASARAKSRARAQPRCGGMDRRQFHEPLPPSSDIREICLWAADDGPSLVSPASGRRGDDPVLAGPSSAAEELGHQGVGTRVQAIVEAVGL